MLEPLPADQFTREHAAHLLNRAGFGAPPAEVDRFFALGLPAAVATLVQYEKTPDTYPDPAWTTLDPQEVARIEAIRFLPDDQKRAAQQEIRKTYRREDLELIVWWLERMRTTTRPLQEKMTLFWHSLFATSVVKVRNPLLMWKQNQTFRSLATGNWPDLLVAMGTDPAMLVWLDGRVNKKDHPNENFAREVMELFTLGEGNYTEQDIKQSARAFAGWHANPITAEFNPGRPGEHDMGTKTYLGQTGPFSGEDILRILGNAPRSAQYVCERLWRYFGSEEPNPQLTGAMAGRFQDAGLNFKPLLTALFLSRDFYAPEIIRQQVKGPIQWLVGSCRVLERPLPPPLLSYQMLRLLGQVPFDPPSVKGWDTGVSWISTNTLLDRYNFSALLVGGQLMGLGLGGGPKTFTPKPKDNPGQGPTPVQDPAMMQTQTPAAPPRPFPNLQGIDIALLFTPQELADNDAFLDALQKRLIEGPLGETRRNSLRDYLQKEPPGPDRIKGAIRLLMSTPDYQLT